jgi:hypothetical protein
MWKNKQVMIILLLALMSLGLFGASAQDIAPVEPQAEETDVPIPPQQTITITSFAPAQFMTGQEITLSVLGSGFSAASIVRLREFSVLITQFISPNTLTATIPATIPPGTYTVEVIDHSCALCHYLPQPPNRQPPPRPQPPRPRRPKYQVRPRCWCAPSPPTPARSVRGIQSHSR